MLTMVSTTMVRSTSAVTGQPEDGTGPEQSTRTAGGQLIATGDPRQGDGNLVLLVWC